MSALPNIHLCIVQPAGYVHSLGFLDQARHFRFQFRRHGATVSMAKNRLHHGAIVPQDGQTRTSSRKIRRHFEHVCPAPALPCWGS